MKLAQRKNGSYSVSPWSPLFDVDHFFDRFFDAPCGEGEPSSTKLNPPLDLSETDREVIIRSEIPGVSPDELEITVDGDVLTLTGEKKRETKAKDVNHYYVERQFGSFHRQLQLPSSVDPESVTADYKDGVLTLTAPKKETATPKKITIKSKN